MLTDLESVTEQLTADGRGGKRPGAGRKKRDGSPNKSHTNLDPGFETRTPEQLLEDGPPPQTDLVPDESDDSPDLGAITFTVPDNPGALYAGAKARKEAALAAKAELEFRVKAGQYLPREAIRSALAKAYQAVAQSLRSIPDNLERKLGVSPEVAEAVGVEIDTAMGDLAYSMEKMHTENTDALAQD